MVRRRWERHNHSSDWGKRRILKRLQVRPYVSRSRLWSKPRPLARQNLLYVYQPNAQVSTGKDATTRQLSPPKFERMDASGDNCVARKRALISGLDERRAAERRPVQSVVTSDSLFEDLVVAGKYEPECQWG